MIMRTKSSGRVIFIWSGRNAIKAKTSASFSLALSGSTFENAAIGRLRSIVLQKVSDLVPDNKADLRSRQLCRKSNVMFALDTIIKPSLDLICHRHRHADGTA
jgi:hypothetical protein